MNRPAHNAAARLGATGVLWMGLTAEQALLDMRGEQLKEERSTLAAIRRDMDALNEATNNFKECAARLDAIVEGLS